MLVGTYWLLNWKAQKKVVLWKRITAPVILLVALLLVTCDQGAGYTISASTTGSPMARVVYAQPNFTTHTLYTTGQNTLKNAGYIAADNHGGFYVVDYDNNRVLHFPSTTGTGSGPQADQVYGQPDYTSNAAQKDATGLNHPHGVAIDRNGGLYISDMLNNRVLHYPAASKIPDRVYGQFDFTATDINSEGLSAGSLYHPQGIAVDSTGFYVADSSNNRVLHFPLGSRIADFVYGQGTPGNSQANFSSNAAGNGATGLNNPRDVAVDSTGLYVADSGNHRVVRYLPGNPMADRVYGQPDFASKSVQANQGLLNPTAATLDNPTMMSLDQHGGLYIADRNNNRILYYPPSTQEEGNDPSATRVYGQLGYTTRYSSTTARTFDGPGAVAVDNIGDVFVLDIFNQRVLKFVTGLNVSDQPPAVVATSFGTSHAATCAGYIAHPFSKEAVFTLECRRCDPSFPAFLQGSRSQKEGHGCPDHDGFSACSQVQSTLCPGVSRLHLLYSRYGSEAGTRVSTMQRQGRCHLNHLACRGGEQL